MTITLYDIPSTLPQKAWSPNTFKARTALNIKGLQYKTEWVEYPDIASVCKKLGAQPTTKMPSSDGQLVDHYTLPVIHDSKTGRVISESFAIVQYLDETYPDTPRLIPEGTSAAIALFSYTMESKIVFPLVSLGLSSSQVMLNEKSREYFKQTRELWLGVTAEEMAQPGPKRNDAWAKFKEGLEILATFYGKNDGTSSTKSKQFYFINNTLTYADIVIGSFLCMMKVMLTQYKCEFDWDQIENLNGGLWGNIAGEIERYRQVV